MKKITAFVLVMLMVLSMATTAFAAGTAIAVSSATAAQGENVTVTVNLSGNPGMAMLELGISYDTTRLEKVSFAASGLPGGMVNESAVWIGTGDSAYNGTILTLNFKVLDNAPVGDAEVEVWVKSAANWNEDDISISVSSGKITVTKPAHNHIWDAGTVTTAATCESAGVKTFKCTVAECTETKTEPIPATGHTFGEWIETKAPTCTDKGSETRKCVCGETETRDVAAKGHTFGEWTETKAPTCTEKGTESRKCVCGETETRDVAATGHTYGEWTETKAPTCTEKGNETRKCVCGETETRDVAAKGHTYGEWKVTKAATCTEKGEETRECTCGEMEIREIPVKDHSLNSYGKDTTHHWALCDECDYVGEKEAHDYDYNGVCECGAKKTIEVDPDLDDVPMTGDITPYIAMTFVFVLALAAAVAFTLKRKAAK